MKNNRVEDAKKQIKELNKEIQSLRNKRAEYERILDDEERKAKLSNHSQFIGKCFLNRKLPFDKQKYIVAFQVIEIEKYPKDNYATCLMLVDGHEHSAWNKYGVVKATIGLWNHNELRMMPKDDEPLVIDMFEEITWEKFYELAHEHFDALRKTIVARMEN